MKILVVCQHYWPEPYPLPDVCEELVRRGHRVRVVTGVPNYPLGFVYPAYRKRQNRDEIHNGVEIHRSFTIGRRKGRFFRVLNYFSFALSSLLYALCTQEQFDVVFANQTSPVMMAGGALAYGKKHDKQVVLYCMDLWPTSLTAGGIREGSLIYRVFHRVSGKIYRAADRILISSEPFRGYLEEHFQIPADRIVYHPQYADVVGAAVPPANKETVDLMFAGNIGAAQSLPTILRAAKMLEDRPFLRWHIVGDGSALDRCRRMAGDMKLRNVVFHGRQKRAAMPEYFAMADAMILTMVSDPLLSMTLPGKLQTYMAAEKPILAAVDGAAARTIAEADCGFCAAAEDAEALAEAVLRFLDFPDKETLAKNARSYYEAHFSRASFMERMEAALKAAGEGKAEKQNARVRAKGGAE